jgi:beta-glucuronidase
MKFLHELLSEIEVHDSSRLSTAALLSGSEEQFRSLVLVLALQGAKSQWVNQKEKAIFQLILDEANIPIDSQLSFSLSIDDPLGESVDLISYNEYFGWYYVTFFADQMMIDEGTLRKLMFEVMQISKSVLHLINLFTFQSLVRAQSLAIILIRFGPSNTRLNYTSTN